MIPPCAHCDRKGIAYDGPTLLCLAHWKSRHEPATPDHSARVEQYLARVGGAA